MGDQFKYLNFKLLMSEKEETASNRSRSGRSAQSMMVNLDHFVCNSFQLGRFKNKFTSFSHNSLDDAELFLKTDNFCTYFIAAGLLCEITDCCL